MAKKANITKASTKQLRGGPGSKRAPGGPGTMRTEGGPGSKRSPGAPGTMRTGGGPGTKRSPGAPGTMRSSGAPGTIRIPGEIAGGPGCLVPIPQGSVVKSIHVKGEKQGGDIILKLRFQK